MPKAQHVLTIKLNARDTGEKAKLKKQIAQMVSGELTPAIETFLKEFLLYRPKGLVGKTTLESFRKNNAGVITKALIDNVDKASLDPKSSWVEVQKMKTKSGTEVSIDGAALPQVYKALSDKKLSGAAIMQKVMGFDYSRENQVLDRAAKALKDEARS